MQEQHRADQTHKNVIEFNHAYGTVHKQYIDEDDRDNIPDYWEDLLQE